ncbi:MAG: tRNA (N6-threonylcarbamoyladenosine(37)-N6)-methyltransferase TrmO [Lachnospiraceae bacterium]|nr:tRNA (N6-threonylcarbamoyladenosine(37)-N6)-methyltransferase TrmO [Lachnospiraceae bacterium]
MEALYGEYKIIARIYNDYETKFGIPRQSGIVNESESVIIFEPSYRSVEAVRGLEEYSHIWLLWLFSENKNLGYKATVRPPRLGGNKRVGVYATRSPYRPNPIGLSSVKINKVDCISHNSPLIYVAGADMLNGTPILDIKPYLPYCDSHVDAIGGFADKVKDYALTIEDGIFLLEQVSEDKREAIKKILENDPRPAYHDSPDRIYSFEYGGYHVEFSVEGTSLCVRALYEVD